MINRPNKTMMGAFIIGGLVLIIISLMTFGVGRYLVKQPTFVMFFEGSVKGLNVGSPVVFKGVKVGRVTEISLRLSADSKTVLIQVLAELDPESIKKSEESTDPQEFIQSLVRKGLKAQLLYNNLLTGQLVVELDYHPEKPAKLIMSEIKYPEIPTIPSSMETFTRTLEKLPLEELVKKLTSAIEGIERTATSPELMKSIRNLNLVLKNMQSLLENANSKIEPISSDIKGALTDSRKMIQDFDRNSASLQESIKKTSEAAHAAMVQAEKTFKTVERTSSDDSPAMYNLNQTLEKISAASDSLQNLSDYLNRHPEALLYGKKEPK